MPVEIRAGKAIVARIASGSQDRHADARLIAAAPELLAALRDLHSALSDVGFRFASATNARDSIVLDKAMDDASAVIAKVQS